MAEKIKLFGIFEVDKYKFQKQGSVKLVEKKDDPKKEKKEKDKKKEKEKESKKEEEENTEDCVENDELEITEVKLEKDKEKSILGKLSGPAFLCDDYSRNDVYYSRDFWERVISEYQEKIDDGLILNTIGHDDDVNEVVISKGMVSHVLRKMWIEEATKDCPAVGHVEIEILNTPTGQILYALLAAGSKLSISSKVYAEVTNIDGTNLQVSPNGEYEFLGFDIVQNPGVAFAVPTFEKLKENNSKDENNRISITKKEMKMENQNPSNDFKTQILSSLNEGVKNGSVNDASALDVMQRVFNLQTLYENEAKKSKSAEQLSATRKTAFTQIAALHKGLQESYRNLLTQSGANQKVNELLSTEIKEYKKFGDINALKEMVESAIVLSEKYKELDGKYKKIKENKNINQGRKMRPTGRSPYPFNENHRGRTVRSPRYAQSHPIVENNNNRYSRWLEARNRPAAPTAPRGYARNPINENYGAPRAIPGSAYSAPRTAPRRFAEHAPRRPAPYHGRGPARGRYTENVRGRNPYYGGNPGYVNEGRAPAPRYPAPQAPNQTYRPTNEEVMQNNMPNYKRSVYAPAPQQIAEGQGRPEYGYTNIPNQLSNSQGPANPASAKTASSVNSVTQIFEKYKIKGNHSKNQAK